MSDERPRLRSGPGAGEAAGSDPFRPTRLSSLLDWASSFSLDVLPFAPACCSQPSIESAYGPHHNLDRNRSGPPRYSPRQADLLLVAGPVTPQWVPVLQRTYSQMHEPKWVVALGSCACSGGGYETYATRLGLGRILPVDLWVAGCPPRPEVLIDGLLELRARIKKSGNSRASWGMAGEQNAGVESA